jgi:hypothetical protein
MRCSFFQDQKTRKACALSLDGSSEARRACADNQEIDVLVCHLSRSLNEVPNIDKPLSDPNLDRLTP